MDLRVPTDEEIDQLIIELENDLGNVHPEYLEFGKRELFLAILETIRKLTAEFPDDGYSPLTIYSENGKEFHNKSTVAIFEGKDGLPYLDVNVYRDDDSWAFNGLIEFERFVGHFAGISFKYMIGLKKSNPDITDIEFKESLQNMTASVLRMALRRLPKWVELMVDSFDKTIDLIWGKYLYEDIKKEHYKKGIEIPKLDLNAQRQNTIRSIESKIRDFIGNDAGFEAYLLRRKKKSLALHYRDIFSHWKTIQEMQFKAVNWQRYIRPDDMSDITDDLIEEFEKGKNIGDLALEQSARRVELYNNVNLTNKALKLRAMGIMCSGYSRSNLFSFKKDGEKYIEEDAVASPTDKNSDWTES